ncbi:MAG: helix-turn-helix domain-containing protein [Alphaproteobacteria bacterium]
MDIRSTGRGTGLVHPVDAHVGFKMRELRVLNGISQEVIAERLAVSFQQIQKYETGRNRISASRLYELSVIFGVSVDHFYDGLTSSVHAAVCDAVGVDNNDPIDENEIKTDLSQLTDRQTLILMQQFSEIKSHNVKRKITELVKGLANPDLNDDDPDQEAA